MNKSLEALEELKDEIIPDYALEYEDDEGYKDWVIELYQTIKQDLERLEELELEVHCKNNSIKTLETLHKSQIEKYLKKENKLLDELIICKQQIKILKKALPYYNIKVLCNAGRITEEELELLLKYEELNDDK